jgi:tRNA-2-methylthio-N6-dimethylallyladenosine synthase
MVRESAENRVYGLLNNLEKIKQQKFSQDAPFKIIVTGCLSGLAIKDKSGKFLRRLKEKFPMVDEFLPIEEVGFDWPQLRSDGKHAWIPISNGCNNFCSYCVVPYTRGREISRPYGEIIAECQKLKDDGYEEVTLLGQNVNSYGADLHNNPGGLKQSKKPIYVKHLGRYRIPTLFPYLLEEVAKLGFKLVNFMSSNPWDFSNELIDVIVRNPNITRTIHLPMQSGDDEILKKMNRWYTANEYLELVRKLKLEIKNLRLTTDIIVGFCGETDEQFRNTVKLCKKVGFHTAFIGRYSPRPYTAATKVMNDDVPPAVKKKRWLILENLINKPRLNKEKKLRTG